MPQETGKPERVGSRLDGTTFSRALACDLRAASVCFRLVDELLHARFMRCTLSPSVVVKDSRCLKASEDPSALDFRNPAWSE